MIRCIVGKGGSTVWDEIKTKYAKNPPEALEKSTE